jgi:hypothetical protein
MIASINLKKKFNTRCAKKGHTEKYTCTKLKEKIKKGHKW